MTIKYRIDAEGNHRFRILCDGKEGCECSIGGERVFIHPRPECRNIGTEEKPTIIAPTKGFLGENSGGCALKIEGCGCLFSIEDGACVEWEPQGLGRHFRLGDAPLETA